MRRDLISLPDNSRVWIYQANNFIDDSSLGPIKDELIEFTKQWESHGIPVSAYGHIFHRRFLVLVADENNHVSGCSIDSSVHFIQNLGSRYGLDFFDRTKLLYFRNTDILEMTYNAISNGLESGNINGDTLVFNNLVKSKREFIESWVIPLKDCWMKRYLVNYSKA